MWCMHDYKYDPNARDYKYALRKGLVKFLEHNAKRSIGENNSEKLRN